MLWNSIRSGGRECEAALRVGRGGCVCLVVGGGGIPGNRGQMLLRAGPARVWGSPPWGSRDTIGSLPFIESRDHELKFISLIQST